MRFFLVAIATCILILSYLSAPSCSALDVAVVPVEVVQATDTRTQALAVLETAWPVPDTVLVAELQAEHEAWAMLEGSTSFVTPAAMKSTLQSQKIAVEVAIQKILAGEYNDAEKLELVQALQTAWANLASYYKE